MQPAQRRTQQINRKTERRADGYRQTDRKYADAYQRSRITCREVKRKEK